MSGQSLITVIDDDDSVRESLESLIRSVGFAVETFSSAEEFLNSVRRCDTCCLILDVRMPGMNGLELQHQLTTSESVLPVIFITAHDDETARLQAVRNGAIDYLIKPFSEDSLLKAIRKSQDQKL